MRHITLLALLAATPAAHAYDNVKDEIYVRPSRYQETLHPDYRPMPPAPTVAQFWNGTHVGAYAITGRTKVESTDGLGRSANFKAKGTGVGVTVGKDWQRGNIVIGVAADVAYRNADGDTTFAGRQDEAETGTMGAARARLGVIAGGRTLLYGTAGLGIARTTYEVNGQGETKTVTGPMYGVGAEFAMNPNTAARIELRQTDYGSVSLGGPAALARKAETKDTALLIGLTRKLSY